MSTDHLSGWRYATLKNTFDIIPCKRIWQINNRSHAFPEALGEEKQLRLEFNSDFCVYDCAYCANRASNDIARAAFTPMELADLTVAPLGQSTQLIIGAISESDYGILHVADRLYQDQALKRVYYSGYVPINAADPRLHLRQLLRRYWQYLPEKNLDWRNALSVIAIAIVAGRILRVIFF